LAAPVTHNLSLGRGQLLEGSHGFFRFALLKYAKSRVKQHDGRDGNRLNIFAYHRGDHRSQNQDNDQEATELIEQFFPEGWLRCCS
jgi:hypothetical protein